MIYWDFEVDGKFYRVQTGRMNFPHAMRQLAKEIMPDMAKKGAGYSGVTIILRGASPQLKPKDPTPTEGAGSSPTPTPDATGGDTKAS